MKNGAMAAEHLLGARDVVLLEDRAATGDLIAFDPATGVRGSDVHERTEIVFESPDGRFRTGIWEDTLQGCVTRSPILLRPECECAG